MKASTRLWPPELECMAQVKTLLWQHSTTATDKAAASFTLIYISLIVEISFLKVLAVECKSTYCSFTDVFHEHHNCDSIDHASA